MRRAPVPTVLQMEAAECGAASLGMILGYHGAFVPLEELRYQCGVSRDGMKAGNILRAARRYGLAAKGYKKEPERLREMTMPVILHWNFNHFLVLEGVDAEGAWLNDPAAGLRRVSTAVLDESFTGVTLAFEKTADFVPRGRAPSVWRSLIGRLDGSARALVFAVLVNLLLVVPGFLTPFFTRIFVDDVLVAEKADWLWPLLAVMGAVGLLQVGLTWLRERNLLELRTKLALSGSGRFLWHVLRLELRFFEARRAGDVAGRVHLNENLAVIIAGQLTTAAIDAALVVFYLGVMLAFDAPLTAVAVGAALINGAALRLAARRQSALSARLARAQGALSAVEADGLLQIETIKSTGGEDRFFATWAGRNAQVVSAQQEVAGTSLRLDALPSILAAFTHAGVLCWGALRILDGEMTLGTLVAFQSLTGSFLAPVQALLGLWSAVQQLPGTIMRLDDVMAQPVFGLPEGDGALAVLGGRVALEDVSFGYSPCEPPLIEGLSLQVQPGQRVALVGRSGSGKSTLAKLVTGAFPPWRGRILFDGVPREAHDRRALLPAVCAVDQEIVLFAGTVRENLTLWDDTVPHEELVRAAKDACIHDTIMSLPGGYDAVLEEGGRNLSGGQRQRLELARALVSNPAVLVLDEATSALDAAVEAEIDANLRRRGCTCLIIAHRLSTVRDAEQIVVLERGRVVERGTHAELMDRGGHYRALVSAA